MRKQSPTLSTIFEVQPEWCRAPLKPKILRIETESWWLDRPERIEVVRRVLFYDPTDLYARIAPFIDPFQRHPGLSMDVVFPKLDRLCACGCGKLAAASDRFKEDGITPTWQRKWHNESCSQFANDVCSILNNNFQKPSKYITYYHGDRCSECNDKTYDIELDHLHGVKQGGGGAWLSNYKWKCRKCHVDKTNATFKRGRHKESGQPKLF